MERYYHKLTDEWRADYDFTAALQNLDLLYRLGLTVADSESWPAWKPTARVQRHPRPHGRSAEVDCPLSRHPRACP